MSDPDTCPRCDGRLNVQPPGLRGGGGTTSSGGKIPNMGTRTVGECTECGKWAELRPDGTWQPVGD